MSLGEVQVHMMVWPLLMRHCIIFWSKKEAWSSLSHTIPRLPVWQLNFLALAAYHVSHLTSHDASKNSNLDHDITYLYKLVPGVSERSFGFKVAQLAQVINSRNYILLFNTCQKIYILLVYCCQSNWLILFEWIINMWCITLPQVELVHSLQTNIRTRNWKFGDCISIWAWLLRFLMFIEISFIEFH